MGCHRSIEDDGCKGLKKADADHRMVSEGHWAGGVVVAVAQAGPGVRTQMVEVRIGEGIVALEYLNLGRLVLPHKHKEWGSTRWRSLRTRSVVSTWTSSGMLRTTLLWWRVATRTSTIRILRLARTTIRLLCWLGHRRF